jgi:hypothetical protein
LELKNPTNQPEMANNDKSTISVQSDLLNPQKLDLNVNPGNIQSTGQTQINKPKPN